MAFFSRPLLRDELPSPSGRPTARALDGARHAAKQPRAAEPTAGEPQRLLHVYVAALVQTYQDREVALWNPGPILAWSDAQALERAIGLLMQHPEPIPVFGSASKPRLKVQRVHAGD
jgi:hypothetical protein